jgi:2-oxo-4-hydroxy-4-carboxy-5-ureidoimidazoline decarboxylase
MTLEELNRMDRDAFTGALGWIFEHSQWVAERSWARRPFDSLASLHKAMVREVSDSDTDAQVALIRAHPDLGARARMSDASVDEQASAGLDRLTPAEFERLHRLNAAYGEKFGFPFIYAVKGSTMHDILRALEERLAGDPPAEHATALAQIYRIAQFRLEDTIHA